MAAGDRTRQGLALGMAMQIQESIEAKLEKMEAELRSLREFTINRKHFELPVGGQAGIGETRVEFPEPLPQGFVFTAQRLVATAPEKSKLQIFRDSIVPRNLIEVAANVQEYADGILGPLVIEGGARLFAVISGAAVAGSFSVVLSGELLPITPKLPKETR